jgi:hypothetical protein
MSLNLDPGTFGGTQVCHILVEKLNKHGDAKLAAAITNFLTLYFRGLRDLIQVNQPTRHHMMRIWLEKHLVYANESIKNRMDDADIEFSFFDNIMKTRYKKSVEHAAIIDRLCYGDDENRDYKAILDRLVDIDRRRDYELLDEK